MDFSVDQLCLKDAMMRVNSIVDHNSPNPFFKGALLSTRENHVFISVNQMTVSYNIELPATVRRQGSLVVEAAKLVAFAKTAPSKPIKLVAADSGSTVRVTAGGSRHKLRAYSAEDFPSPTYGDQTSAVAQARDVMRVLQAVSFAMVDWSTRENLYGVNLCIQDSNCSAEASDGTCYAKAQLQSESASGSLTVLVPRPVVALLVRMLDADGSVTFSHSDRSLTVRVADQSCLISLGAEFPNLAGSLPGTFYGFCSVDRRKLQKVIKRWISLVGKTAPLAMQSGVLSLGSDADGSERLKCNLANDYAWRVVINAEQFLRGVQSLSDDEVQLCFAGPTEPFFVKAGFVQFYVMPVVEDQ